MTEAEALNLKNVERSCLEIYLIQFVLLAIDLEDTFSLELMTRNK